MFQPRFKPPTAIIRKHYRLRNNNIEAVTLEHSGKRAPDGYDDAFHQFCRITTAEQAIVFVSEYGFLTWSHSVGWQEPIDFFMGEAAIANKYSSLYDAAIAPNGIELIKKRISMELSPHYDETDPFADSAKFICIFDGNEINQTPHIKQTGAETSVGIPCEPFMYNFNKFDHNNPAHWRNIAAEVVFRGIHEYTKRIFLGFDPIKTATPSEKNDPWEVYSKPCLICEDLLTAMYFYFYLRVTSPHNERICRKCATTFKPSSHKEKYCFDCRYDLINGTQIKKYPSQNLWNNTHRNKKGESSK